MWGRPPSPQSCHPERSRRPPFLSTVPEAQRGVSTMPAHRERAEAEAPRKNGIPSSAEECTTGTSEFPIYASTAPMSSIKRDVKKKAPPRAEDRGCFSRSSPLCFVTLKRFGLSSILVSFLCCWWQSSSVKDAASRRCQPWFYPRLVAYRYFWLSEGA